MGPLAWYNSSTKLDLIGWPAFRQLRAKAWPQVSEKLMVFKRAGVWERDLATKLHQLQLEDLLLARIPFKSWTSICISITSLLREPWLDDAFAEKRVTLQCSKCTKPLLCASSLQTTYFPLINIGRQATRDGICLCWEHIHSYTNSNQADNKTYD